MQRLILNNSGLFISKPGVNVASVTDLRDYVFNSNAFAYIGLFARGTIGIGAFQSGSQQNSNFSATSTVTYDVDYGQTFSSPPLVLAMFTSSHEAGASPTFNEGNSGTVQTPGFVYGTGGETWANVTSYVDHAHFEIDTVVLNQTMPGPSEIAYYIAQK